MGYEKFEEKKLSEEELEKVTGGTAKEFNQIVSAVVTNVELMNDFKSILGNIPEGKLNLEEVKSALTGVFEGLGIKAQISLDTAENTYKDKKRGKQISHEEAIKRIRNYI